MRETGLYTARFRLSSAGSSNIFRLDGEPFEIIGKGKSSLRGASIPMPESPFLARHSMKR